jgi:hypothetical protein
MAVSATTLSVGLVSRNPLQELNRKIHPVIDRILKIYLFISLIIYRLK